MSLFKKKKVEEKVKSEKVYPTDEEIEELVKSRSKEKPKGKVEEELDEEKLIEWMQNIELEINKIKYNLRLA